MAADLDALIVYALACFSSSAMTMTRPAQGALLPSLAETPEELTAANGLTAVFEGAGVLIGPLAAAAVLTVAQPTAVVVAGTITLGIASVLAMRVHVPADEIRTAAPAGDVPPSDTPETSDARQVPKDEGSLLEGFRLFARQRDSGFSPDPLRPDAPHRRLRRALRVDGPGAVPDRRVGCRPVERSGRSGRDGRWCGDAECRWAPSPRAFFGIRCHRRGHVCDRHRARAVSRGGAVADRSLGRRPVAPRRDRSHDAATERLRRDPRSRVRSAGGVHDGGSRARLDWYPSSWPRWGFNQPSSSSAPSFRPWRCSAPQVSDASMRAPSCRSAN